MGPALPSAPLLLVVAAAACGGGGGSEGNVGGTLPSCATAGKPVQLPSSLASFPLPKGGVIDDTRKDVAGNTVYGGVVPGDLKATRDWYEENLPKSGYDVREGDSEEHEAEAEFEGHGVEARYKVRDIADCDGALSLEVALK